jgi:hypothetical protein
LLKNAGFTLADIPDDWHAFWSFWSDEVRPRCAPRRLGTPSGVMPVAPAVGEPLAEPGAPDLPAQLGHEPAACVARPGGRGAFDIAQLGLQIRLERAREGGGKLHFRIQSRRPKGFKPLRI